MGLQVKHHSFNFHIPHLHFHHHHHHERQEDERKETKSVPKGCMAVMVGTGEMQERFVIPVFYVNHPLFMALLKEAEEEYGFDQKGPISIPCGVEEFRKVQGNIESQEHHYCFRH